MEQISRDSSHLQFSIIRGRNHVHARNSLRHHGCHHRNQYIEVELVEGPCSEADQTYLNILNSGIARLTGRKISENVKEVSGT